MASRKHRAIGGEDHTDCIGRCNIAKGLCEFEHHIERQGIALLRPVESDGGEGSVGFDGHVLVAHRVSLAPFVHLPAPRRLHAVGSLSRLSITALTATMMLDPDIDSAAISGRSTRPREGSNTPAAIGKAMTL